MPRENFTDEEKELLTAEELAGLEEEDEDDEATETNEGDGGDTGDDAGETAEGDKEKKQDTGDEAGNDETPDDESGDDKPDDKAGQQDITEENQQPGQDETGVIDTGGEAEKDAGEKETTAVSTRPASWAEPEGARDRMDAIEGELDALAEKFDDGELTGKEFREQQRKLEKEHRDLDWSIRSAQNNVQAAADAWNSATVPTFMAEHPEYKANDRRLKVLDTTVRELQHAAIEKGENHLDPAILAEAHRQIEEAFGPAPGKKAPDPKATAKNKDPKNKRGDPPPTLANVPSDNITETGDDGRFAAIDRLEGVAYETALGKLSDADRETYLASR